MDTTKAIQAAVARVDLAVCAAVLYGRIAVIALAILGIWMVAREVRRKWRT